MSMQVSIFLPIRWWSSIFQREGQMTGGTSKKKNYYWGGANQWSPVRAWRLAVVWVAYISDIKNSRNDPFKHVSPLATTIEKDLITENFCLLTNNINVPLLMKMREKGFVYQDFLKIDEKSIMHPCHPKVFIHPFRQNDIDFHNLIIFTFYPWANLGHEDLFFSH